MVAQVIGTSAPNAPTFSGGSPCARRLGPAERTGLAVQALAGTTAIAELARQHEVSRKFVYQQRTKASNVLEEAFAGEAQDDQILLRLPVTKAWVRQFVLELALLCHSSFRAITEVLGDLFGRSLSLGTVHNIVQAAVREAQSLNDRQDLSAVRVGAHDEIYQAGRPVLVGVDVRSTYCYLLALEDHCDETTWGVHLLELCERGLRPDYTIADGGKALRAGQAAAWGKDVACHGDVFHAERELGMLARFLANRAAGCTATRRKIERKMDPTKKDNGGRDLCCQLAAARKEEARAVDLAGDLRALADWMRQDVLSLAGANRQTRGELFDFIVEELRAREALCAHRIRPVRGMLERSRDNLLAFAEILDERFDDLAARFKIPTQVVHDLCELQGMDPAHPAYWQRQGRLRKKTRGRFDEVQAAVRKILAETPRASSLVENLNSRVRSYFFLRRHIGNGYLDLLRFFLNHHRFPRSERPERTGKSPAELLTGTSHAHWLELLGYPLPAWN
jgi:hypothetical protein